jgi:hypothetical protein
VDQGDSEEQDTNGAKELPLSRALAPSGGTSASSDATPAASEERLPHSGFALGGLIAVGLGALSSGLAIRARIGRSSSRKEPVVAAADPTPPAHPADPARPAGTLLWAAVVLVVSGMLVRGLSDRTAGRYRR